MPSLSRWFRERIRARKLKSEDRLYANRFDAARLVIPGDVEISARIDARCGVRKPTQDRPRVLLVYHDHNWEGANLGPGLAEIADIEIVDWFDRSDSTLSLRDARESRHRRLLEAYERARSRGLVHAVFTYVSGEQVAPRTIEALRAERIPLVNLSLNDRESFVGKVIDGVACGMRDIAPLFDLCWTSTMQAMVKYVVEGACPVWMPEGANPAVHRNLQLPRDLDVVFVGQSYGERPEMLRLLRRNGIDAHAFGLGWPSGPVAVEEMVRLWNRARIVLGFSGILGHHETFCLKGRDFEVPMSGSCYLTRLHPELERAFSVGSEIAAYESPQDLVAVAKALLADAPRRARIGQAGASRARRDHSWRKRFERVLRLVGVLSADSTDHRHQLPVTDHPR